MAAINYFLQHNRKLDGMQGDFRPEPFDENRVHARHFGMNPALKNELLYYLDCCLEAMRYCLSLIVQVRGPDHPVRRAV